MSISRLRATYITALVSTNRWTGATSDAIRASTAVGADAGPGEHFLDQHVGPEQEREHHAERGDDRQHRVAERVGHDHLAARQAAG
ncbi:hypothetical protein RSA36_22110, partial [Pantoea stewartii]